ncbi:MAG: SBBP repeat-containing protein [Planctomycetota bacterium]
MHFATYLGGSGFDEAREAAIDASGASYVAGHTESFDFPTTPGAYDTGANGTSDAFVAKLSEDGDTLLWATYLGGSGIDGAYGLAVDPSGAVYVAGSTTSANFPSTLFGYAGGTDAFITKLNAAGSAVVYSTYLGGSASDGAFAIARDASGAVYVAGGTDSASFPTTSGAYDRSYNSGQDGFIAKLDAAGTTLVYATFLGGSSADVCHAIALDATGAAFVAGETRSSNFPLLGGFDSLAVGTEGFVTKLNNAGSALVYSSFLGGAGTDVAGAIAVNDAGEALLAGSTTSADFPATPGAFDTTYNGNGDAFVSRVSASGAALVFSTFLGGSGTDGANDLKLTRTGYVWVAGTTGPSGFPTTPDAYDTSYGGGLEAFVTAVSAGGGTLIYSTLLGGTGYDLALGLGINSADELVVAGTTSGDFPTTSRAYDRTFGGVQDAFVVKFDHQCGGGPATLFTFTGDSAGDRFGSAVAGAGDVNGDGFADLIVGAPHDDVAGAFSGSAFVYSGRDGNVLHAFHGAISYAYFAHAVGSAGDVDADGLDDVLVGLGESPGGNALVYSGATGDLLLFCSGGGYSVSDAGDVNRDGFPDVIVGGPPVYVYSGKDNTRLFTFNGDDPSDWFGFSVAGAGDTNADGFPDLVVGTVNASGFWNGSARFFSGNDGAIIRTLEGDSYNDLFGYYLDGVGDVNHDGFADAVVSAPGDDVGGDGTGTAWIFSGKNGVALLTFVGSATAPVRSASNARDIDLDGTSDVILGAGSGIARVLSGKDGKLLLAVGSQAPDDFFGSLVAGAGDVDQDGRPDIIVGASKDDAHGADSGAAYVFGCGSHASWSNYGVGWPGTNGTPSLTANDDPVICSTIALEISNSRGAATTSFLFLGLSQASTPTIFDGTLLVVPLVIMAVPLPGGGLTLPMAVPCDNQLADISAFLQVLEVDPGASKGVSFTPGLMLTLGH